MLVRIEIKIKSKKKPKVVFFFVCFLCVILSHFHDPYIAPHPDSTCR